MGKNAPVGLVPFLCYVNVTNKHGSLNAASALLAQTDFSCDLTRPAKARGLGRCHVVGNGDLFEEATE